MVSPWIQVHCNFVGHAKVLALAGALGIPAYGAAGLVVSMWCWAAVNALDGDLTKYSTRAIAANCGWKKMPGKFVDALLEVGLLDYSGDRLVIHDWGHYTAALWAAEQKAREASRERMRRLRAAARAEYRAPELPPPPNLKAPRVEHACSAELQEAWDAFVNMRADMRKPLSENGLVEMRARLEELSKSVAGQVAVLKQSVSRRWSGLYQVKKRERCGKAAGGDAYGSFELTALRGKGKAGGGW